MIFRKKEKNVEQKYLTYHPSNSMFDVSTMYENLSLEDKKQKRIPFGLDKNLKPILLDFEDVFNIIIVGESNSGKTAIVKALLSYLISVYKISLIKLFIFDSNGDYWSFNDIPQLFCSTTSDEVQANSNLNEILEIIKERKKLQELKDKSKTDDNNCDSIYQQRIIIVIDDYSDLLQFNNNKELLSRIISEGKDVGVYTMLVTNNISANIITEDLKNKIHNKMILQYGNSSEYKLLFDEDDNDLALRDKGEFVYHNQLLKIRGQGIHISDIALFSIVKELKRIIEKRIAQ